MITPGALAGRLLVTGLLFGLVLMVEFRGVARHAEREVMALWLLVGGGFALTVVGGVLAAYARGRRLYAVELVGDGLLISGLVYFTGGARSVFGFLYVIWIVYAAVSSGARSAVVTCAAATIGFGALVFGAMLGWLPPFEAADVTSVPEGLRAMGTHSLAFAAVAVLAHRLASEVKSGRVELRELGEIHQRIVDNVSSGLLTLSRRWRITSFNREAERITGRSDAAVIGWPLSELFPSLAECLGQGTGVAKGKAGTLTEADLSRGKFRFWNREAEELHLGFSLSSLRDAAGHADGYILIFQDLTRVVQMEDELRRSERLGAVGQLAAGLAHEIRNPLASLGGAIELLAGDLPDTDPSSRRLIRIVQRETARLNRLVSDFLSYARPGPQHRQGVPLRELLDEVWTLLRISETTGIEITLDIPEELQPYGDPDQLRQIFWNLLLNAIQAEPSDQRVHVRARLAPCEDGAEPDQVEIEVSDRGVGIPADDQERIFEPFFTTKPKGTGLGLATVHRVVEAHEGALRVSSSEGEGTTVCVRLPLAPRA